MKIGVAGADCCQIIYIIYINIYNIYIIYNIIFFFPRKSIFGNCYLLYLLYLFF